MSSSRIRRTSNQREYEQVIDEYITLGYKINSRGELTCTLEKPQYGSIASHVIVFCLTVWWTFFIGNILWLLYNYLANSDKVLVKLDTENNNNNNNYQQPPQNNKVHRY